MSRPLSKQEVKQIGALSEVVWFFASSLGCTIVHKKADLGTLRTAAQEVRKRMELYLSNPGFEVDRDLVT